ncbi:myelin protein zero-like 1 like [Labeo rohita]|uniref:myelin protein zero-like 1 like n=1 Tax=Labeo rohita TaxID=84645 RepID=UPI0021E2BE12|nr:myelin protein zero-like 1 like [Labeo rohita]
MFYCVSLQCLSSLIFYYSGGKWFLSSALRFKSRVEWAGDMNKNDASIRVIRMQVEDSGTFSCDVKNPPDVSIPISITKVRVAPSDPETDTV